MLWAASLLTLAMAFGQGHLNLTWPLSELRVIPSTWWNSMGRADIEKWRLLLFGRDLFSPCFTCAKIAWHTCRQFCFPAPATGPDRLCINACSPTTSLHQGMVDGALCCVTGRRSHRKSLQVITTSCIICPSFLPSLLRQRSYFKGSRETEHLLRDIFA